MSLEILRWNEEPGNMTPGFCFEPVTVITLLSATASLIGGLKQASAIKAAGKSEQQRAQFVADQSRVNALQAEAASQRGALEVGRRQRLAESSATNIAAASGGTLDNTFEGIMSGIAAEGTFRKEGALFEGSDTARNLRSSAALSEFDGANAAAAAKQKASSTKFAAITEFASGVGGTFAKKFTPKSGINSAGFSPNSGNFPRETIRFR